MNRNEFEDRERNWNQGQNPRQQEGGWSSGNQQNFGQQGYGQQGHDHQDYGQSGQRQQDRFTQQGTDRTYSMQSGYDDAQRGGYGQQRAYDENFRNQGANPQSSYGTESAWSSSSGYGNQGGWGQQRGSSQQERFSGQHYGQQRGSGYEGQRGGYDFDDRARFQGGTSQQERYGQSSQFSGQGYGQQGGYSQRGMNRGGSSAEYGTPSGFGMEGWGQQAYRGSDYGSDYSAGNQGTSGQEWRQGNRRAQGYPGTDYYSGSNQGSGGQENPWGERSMRGGGASQWSGTTTQWQGPHSGKGPRGYQRSDDRIREDICEMLSHHGDVDASEIDIDVHGGEVTLKGTVEDRWQKRMAEDLIESCSGVKEVRNELRVSRSGNGTSGGQTMGNFTNQGAGTTGTTGSQTSTESSAAAGTTTGRTNETTTARSR